jgi:hypothetical protein
LLTTPQTFHLNTRHISAQGTPITNHTNVLHLSVLPSPWDRLISLLFFLLALLLGNTINLKSRFPEWFLPSHIVLKRQKFGWDDHFANEKAIYRRLAPIQGKFVPVCYGEARCAETEETGPRALVLSDVGGVTLKDSAARGLGGEELERMLEVAFRALSACRVAHDDRNLGNYRLVDGRKRVGIIDFEHSYVLGVDEDQELVTASSVRFVSKYYGMRHGGSANKKEAGCGKLLGSGDSTSEGRSQSSRGFWGGMGSQRALAWAARSGPGFILRRG